MSDKDITTALQNLAESVTEHRVEIGRELGALGAKVETIQKSHEANAVKLDEVLKLELSCPARAGWNGIGREMGEVKGDIRMLRGDATGRVDVGPGTGSIGGVVRQTFGNGNGGVLRPLVLKALPYILLAAVALGAYLTSGGDTEATTRALRAVSDAISSVDAKIEKVEKKVDEVVADTDSELIERTAAGTTAPTETEIPPKEATP